MTQKHRMIKVGKDTKDHLTQSSEAQELCLFQLDVFPESSNCNNESTVRLQTFTKVVLKLLKTPLLEGAFTTKL